METIRTKLIPHVASGKRESWFKHVTSVDKSVDNGYAFHGTFIPVRQEVELPVGAVVIECVPVGSVKHASKEGWIYVVTDTPSPHGPDSASSKYQPHLRRLPQLDVAWDWRADFLSFRDRVAELVEAAKDVQDDEVAQAIETVHKVWLQSASDEQLLAECRKRGLLGD